MLKNQKKILITGAAGFIGSALSKNLIKEGKSIVGIDNLNLYYDKKLKLDRLKDIEIFNSIKKGGWIFEKCDISDRNHIFELFKKYKPTIVINLAAQAGVRYSLKNPESYIQNNIIGFSNILDACIKNKVENFLFASSSSVYGSNKKVPFSEDDCVDHPVSLYAATKRSNELIAHSYSHNYGLACTGLRFFTVYGPWGRPDMAPMIFTKSILEKKPIDIYNFGKMQRDFTFIDDIVNCISACSEKPAFADLEFDFFNPKPSVSFAPFRILNIGNGNPIELLDFINILEEKLGLKAIKNFTNMQRGDVKKTFAETSNIYNWAGFKPKTNLKIGVDIFLQWYLNYYHNKKFVSSF